MLVGCAGPSSTGRVRDFRMNTWLDGARSWKRTIFEGMRSPDPAGGPVAYLHGPKPASNGRQTRCPQHVQSNSRIAVRVAARTLPVPDRRQRSTPCGDNAPCSWIKAAPGVVVNWGLGFPVVSGLLLTRGVLGCVVQMDPQGSLAWCIQASTEVSGMVTSTHATWWSACALPGADGCVRPARCCR